MRLGSAFETLWSFFLILGCVHSGSYAAHVLIYQRNGKGFIHDNLAASAQALREIAADLKVDADISPNASVFTAENLKRYQAIIFANSNNEAFETEEQRAAFQRFLQGGGGFMGLHSSTGSERNWNWFQHMQGGRFLRHSPMQTFTVRVVDRSHSGTAHFPESWQWTDECYFFTNINPGIRVLLTMELTSLRDPKLSVEPGQKVDGLFPLAWCHESDGGRRFYTSLGHRIEHYSDPIFREHLRGGLCWVLRLKNKTESSIEP